MASKMTETDSFGRYAFLESITVLIGSKEVSFTVHKDVVCDQSNFFRAACNGKWKEAAEKCVRLPEADPHIFGVYVGWLYTGKLDFSAENGKASILTYNRALAGDYMTFKTPLATLEQSNKSD